jgi:hypothetical protein
VKRYFREQRVPFKEIPLGSPPRECVSLLPSLASLKGYSTMSPKR